MTERVVGLVLAAGASTRFGGAKALAELDDTTFVARTKRLLTEGGCGQVVVVVGPPHGTRVARAVPGAHIVQNGVPERGMLSSLRLGLAEAESLGAGATVVALVDHPFVHWGTVSRLILGWKQTGACLVRPRHAGRHGHPYLLDRWAFQSLSAAPDDEGPRRAMARLTPSLSVPVEDPAILHDFDTPEDLRRFAAGVPRG